MATISDVAKKAGLSVSTVSRVINRKPHVSPEKEAKVKAAMLELGYQPMPAARKLRGSKSKTLVVTVPRITNPFFSDLVDAIERTLDVKGYTVILIQTFGRKDKELAALELLKNHTADGAILCSIENEIALIEDYQKFGVIVLVNEYNKDLNLPSIYADQYQGFKNATEELIKRGYRNIAYVTGHKSINLTNQKRGDLNSDRFAGFLGVIRKNKLLFNSDMLFTNVQTIDDGRKLFNKIYIGNVKIDAIISGSDEVAIGIMESARQKEVKIPSDLGVLGVDNQPLSNDLFIPLSSLQQPTQQMGTEAAHTMLSILEKNLIPQNRVFSLKLISRKSI
ncbi:LacI family DNA-binding transcriptional regulator [Lactobacillus sp. ESL0679]|uniref:LacI family DNA-binding transcriptional regulator n=1 Tax=Lactobacillus sp. ESL0679 TaxID=2983209 RepID=UPI0023F83856|nr:LacI family DNA-binding transcriptional regulator [Lactobacillus sp. ESL0679]MDF7681996.1 LacI family DNA-binding transcriptional regulator [Lactobacillus sp. ESL0679]